ncbi:protein O-mannosyl-transferase TMTC3 [Trichonephila clavipes]|uniref:Protein O-mannosyl-transferase TMTC3 n=1 Tax=Trichonephila clavipes TaxID=2585209 RepID=A0A8X6RDK5_TRICX|nr:protein O-mannosyl-transferase TMTC3 [Trichonephila clavipes]
MSTKLAFGLKNTGVSLQTDHLIQTSAHAPQRPKVTHTGMDTFRLPEFPNVIMKSKYASGLKEAGLRMIALVAFSVFLLLLRLSIMGSQLPVFTNSTLNYFSINGRFDNPAAAAKAPTRQMTMHYLMALNSWLLNFPCDLCCDWTMGTVPLVTSVLDSRNIATLGFYIAFGALLWTSLWEYEAKSKIILMSAAFLAFPFLPASNLFFPVGFVIAERVLYTPSMGFCLLVSYGWSLLHNRIKFKSLSCCFIVFVIFIFAAKTIRRNFDCKDEWGTTLGLSTWVSPIHICMVANLLPSSIDLLYKEYPPFSVTMLDTNVLVFLIEHYPSITLGEFAFSGFFFYPMPVSDLSGRPGATTPAGDRLIALSARRRKRISVSQVVADHSVASGRRIYASTVQRRLHNSGLYAG